jgi:glycosyltransferase involved in cell wall biosynthesis
MGAHHTLAEMIGSSALTDVPDGIIFSGPLNIPAMIQLLPETHRRIPRVAYFHESQWTYPAPNEVDARPYLMQHLDAIRICDEAWFNSHYHLETFWATATSSGVDDRIRHIARALQESHRNRCRVVYPPVAVEASLTAKTQDDTRYLLWNARWEADKRPDRFIALLDGLRDRGHQTDVIILGIAGKDTAEIEREVTPHARSCVIPGYLDSRQEYEQAIGSASVAISTADHEFFGIAMLEAALAGVTPVVPDNLAYPETLPSAFFYRHGDLNNLVTVTSELLNSPQPNAAPRIADATRFTPERTAPVWDNLLSQLAGRRTP